MITHIQIRMNKKNFQKTCMCTCFLYIKLFKLSEIYEIVKRILKGDFIRCGPVEISTIRNG